MGQDMGLFMVSHQLGCEESLEAECDGTSSDFHDNLSMYKDGGSAAGYSPKVQLDDGLGAEVTTTMMVSRHPSALSSWNPC